MVFRMLAVLAEFERDQVSERTAMAMAHKRSQGQRISRHIPYGQQLSADGVHLEANPAEQNVIVLAKELHAAGLSSRKIAAELDARGMRSRVGTAFGSTAILGMVA